MGCKSMIALVVSATSFVISKHSFQGKFDLKVANNFPSVRFCAVELRRWKHGMKLKLSVLLTDDGIICSCTILKYIILKDNAEQSMNVKLKLL